MVQDDLEADENENENRTADNLGHSSRMLFSTSA